MEAVRAIPCPHLRGGAAHRVPWDPGRLLCDGCFLASSQRVQGTDEDSRCDACHRQVPQAPGQDGPLMHGIAIPRGRTLLHFGLCPDCHAADQADTTTTERGTSR